MWIFFKIWLVLFTSYLGKFPLVWNHKYKTPILWFESLKVSLFIPFYTPASLVAQRLKNLPAMQETQVQSLDWEDPLEKGMAPHSSILAWRFPWTEEPGELQFMGLQWVSHDWETNIHLIHLEFAWRVVQGKNWIYYFLSRTPSPTPFTKSFSFPNWFIIN